MIFSKLGLKRLLIFLRATTMILLTTTNIYFISNKLYIYAVFLSALISTMWTLNIRDLAISNWYDRFAYIIGGVIGTSISLYILSGLIK
jgi:hypothetical protein